MSAQSLLERYPSLDDLKAIARKRLPHFAWEYLDSGTGRELAISRNRKALDAIIIQQEGLKGYLKPDTSINFLTHKFNLPIGISPIGMTGLMWAKGERMLADTAKRKNIPYCLSTVSCETPEVIGEIAEGNAWFQLYTFANQSINEDLLKRAMDSGFSTLVVTVDVPVPSMRERQRRGGLRMPPSMTPSFLLDVMRHPAWALATLGHGKPAFRMLEKYASSQDMRELTEFIANQRMGGVYQWKDIARLREIWKGPIIIKGILSPKDAKDALKNGMDGIIVSNHGGRQFDAAPASITVLPEIVKAINGKFPVMFDSGIRGGLDIIKAFALGADFVFAGRPFLYGVGAMGQKGADHAVEILRADLENNMVQLGLKTIAEIKSIKPMSG